jgi:hypothetical protein
MGVRRLKYVKKDRAAISPTELRQRRMGTDLKPRAEESVFLLESEVLGVVIRSEGDPPSPGIVPISVSRCVPLIPAGNVVARLRTFLIFHAHEHQCSMAATEISNSAISCQQSLFHSGKQSSTRIIAHWSPPKVFLEPSSDSDPL